MEKSLQTKEFFKYKVRNTRKASWKRTSNQIRSLFVEPVTNAPLSNQLNFPSTTYKSKAEGIKMIEE